MEFQSMTASPEDDENSSNDETGNAAPDELRTYIIIVNDDGSLSLDPNGIIADDADPQTVFPVSLPVNKMKSPDCPLPGATPVPGASRNRKSKPQAVLYGGENDGVYELNQSDASFTQGKQEEFHQGLPVNGTGAGVDPSIAGTAGVAGPASIDIDQLGPQDIAILENVLKSESARELLENLALPAEDITTPAPVISSHLWDHSYSTLSANIPTPPFVNLSQPPTTVVEPVKKPVEPIAKPSKSIIKVSFSGSNAAKPASPVQPIPRVSPAPLSPVTSTSPSLRRISEGDSASNIRRSQRQQDRIERQEAERIMAENQQMMQREKELMLEHHVGTPTTTATTTATTVVKPPESPLPSSNIQPATMVTPRAPEEVRVASPSIQVQPPLISSPEDSPRLDRRPTRQRKLPAHLADPNYIQFEDDAKPVVAETPKKPPEPEPKQEEVESMDEDADEEAVEDDDPNKLWCICRQPHNNRFMICCDKCDDWFHGKCVGITKAQAKKMETANLPWHCPACKKLIKQEQQNTPKLKMPARASSRRGSQTSSRGSVDTKVAKTPEVTAKPVTQDLTPRRRDSITKSVGRRKSESVSSQPDISGDETSTSSDCIVCGKKSRKDSIFCSDGCISQRANATSKSKDKDNAVIGTPVPTTPIPQSPASQKLKRLNSLKADQEKEKVASFFDFHVIQAGAPKSTEVVPAKQKEATTTQVKLSPSTTTATPTSLAEKSAPKTPASPVKSSSTIQSSKVASSSGNSGVTKQITPKTTEKREKASPTPSKDKSGDNKLPTPKSGRSPSSSTEKAPSSSKDKKKGKESPKEPEVKEKDTKIGKESEALQKNIIRKTLGVTLKNRIKELSEAELALFPPENTPESIAQKIEEELENLYGSTHNAKYKTKYRSIFFNLKDGKNFLFREILQGTLSPKNLVKMESSDMASAELAEWRNRENQKNLDMIKRAEIDKLVEAKKQALIDKGAEIDVVVAEEQGRKLDISDIIQTNENSAENTGESDGGGTSSSGKATGKSHSSSHHRKDKKHDKHSKDNKHNKDSKHRHSSSKDRDRKDSESSSSNKERRSERHRHRSKEQDSVEKLRSKESDSSTKHKDKSKPPSKEEIKKHRESKTERDLDTNREDSKIIKKPDSVEKSVVRNNSEENSPSSGSNQSSIDSSSQGKLEETKHDKISAVRQSIDSEQELPSSTIKTPDFIEEKKEKGEAPVFRTRLVMHELGSFHASAYHVSHNTLQGVVFPESPVPIVGRISPETVWDYLDKMKKTKEVIVLRLAPESDVDNEGYMTFFSYLSSRGRLGVMGGITAPLKDVYLIPLDKHSPVNRALLPFRGPGLPTDRTHCLLAVVTRHITDIPAVIQSKRKPSAASPDISAPSIKKKRIVGAEQQQQSPTSSGSLAKSTVAAKSIVEISTTDATGALTDPRRRKPGSDRKFVASEENKDNDEDDDDDQPYTPWEEEDEKDPELMDISSSPPGRTAAEKLSAQKLLEEINRKIQQERQEIESITVAIKMNENITHIPGLDGDFPSKESSSPVPSASVPFFLKKDLSVPSQTEPVIATSTSTVPDSHIASEKLQQNAAIVKSSTGVPGVSESETPSGSSGDIMEVKKPIVAGEEDQAYSPSGAEFSDDENETKKTSCPPLDATAAKSAFNASVLPKKDDNKNDFIPGLDIVEHEEPDTPKVESSTAAAPELIELEDEEPSPPGEASLAAQAKSTPKPTLDSVFSLPPPNYLSAKPKIQINLATKISSGTIAASSVLPSVASSAKSSPIGVPANSSVSTPVPVSETIAPQIKQSSNAFSCVSLPAVSSTLSSQPPPVQRSSIASIPNNPIVPTIPPPGLATLHPAGIPTSLPPPLTGMPPANIPPPGVMVPVYPPVPPQPNTSTPPPGYHPLQRPNLIPAPPPPVGVNINLSVPPPTVGMVPVTSIPPLPTLRGMPNLTPRFPPHNNSGSNNSSSHPPGRFRPANRFPQGNNQTGLKISPPAHSPPAPSRPSNSPAGSSGYVDRSRRTFGHVGDKHDRTDGSEAQQKSSSYSKGQDRYRNRSYGSRHRSRSRSPARNRSRSRSREKRRYRRHSRSRSRSPSRSTARRRSRSRSPQSSSRYSRSKSPQRSFSRSRSPSSSKSRRRKSHSPTPPVTKPSSSVSTTGVPKK